MRHVVIAPFVNLATAARFHPAKGSPRPVAMRERVTPPGQFESNDPDQIARLIKARCLRAADTGVGRVPGAVSPQTGDATSPPASGDAMSQPYANPDAPSPIPTGEAHDPRVEGGPSDANGGAAGIVDGSSQSGTGDRVPPMAGAGASVQVGTGVSPAGESPPAGTGESPPRGDAVSPPASGFAAVAPPVPPAARQGGADPAPVAGANGGGSGDGTVSHRERRKAARQRKGGAA